MSRGPKPLVPITDRLPPSASELRRHLLRRLELFEREVLALVETVEPSAMSAMTESLAELREMEGELRRLLDEASDPPAWSERRPVIVELWRRHRQTFEGLATRCRRGYPARRGQRSRGPRW